MLPAGVHLKGESSCMQVESLLDEATAELGKMEFSPMLSTIEADFKIKKSVPLHTTLRIECEVCPSLNYLFVPSSRYLEFICWA